jgi:16S rRNA (cytosine1402-N4)-methyltransferase
MHVPVLLDEVLDALAPSRGGLFVDGTVGFAGHAQALLEGGADRLIGIDRDAAAIEAAGQVLAPFGDRVELVHGDYRHLGVLLAARGVERIDGLLVDLGVSSMQLDEPGRGFSFRRDEPLDMRMDRTAGSTAAELLATADERTLADVIFRFGEERYSRRIARTIVAARAAMPIASTGQLADIVRRAVPRRGYSRIDPATRTFQAMRIWVNGELDGLDAFLEQGAGLLNDAGRMGVISFHSLEDRIVKHTFRALVQRSADLLVRTKRPIVPSESEIERNPRSRSAKLRVLERVVPDTIGRHA